MDHKISKRGSRTIKIILAIAGIWLGIVIALWVNIQRNIDEANDIIKEATQAKARNDSIKLREVREDSIWQYRHSVRETINNQTDGPDSVVNAPGN
jgi:hypothetical protein